MCRHVCTYAICIWENGGLGSRENGGLGSREKPYSLYELYHSTMLSPCYVMWVPSHAEFFHHVVYIYTFKTNVQTIYRLQYIIAWWYHHVVLIISTYPCVIYSWHCMVQYVYTGIQMDCNVYAYARGCVSGRMEAEEGETLNCSRVEQIVHACMHAPSIWWCVPTFRHWWSLMEVSQPLGQFEVSNTRYTSPFLWLLYIVPYYIIYWPPHLYCKAHYLVRDCSIWDYAIAKSSML